MINEKVYAEAARNATERFVEVLHLTVLAQLAHRDAHRRAAEFAELHHKSVVRAYMLARRRVAEFTRAHAKPEPTTLVEMLGLLRELADIIERAARTAVDETLGVPPPAEPLPDGVPSAIAAELIKRASKP